MVEDLAWSYLGAVLLVFGMNVAPILMPPTWMVLASFYVANPSLDPLSLALIGATAATCGRFLLMYLSFKGRRFIGEQRKASLDTLGGYLSGKRYVYFITSFLFALGPLPSNLLFITYGIIRARTFGMFLGFWSGRVIAYFVMLSISQLAFRPFIELFTSEIYGIIIFDLLGVGSVVVFASVDWQKLMKERKLVFIRPRFRRQMG